jgi:Xaa-Pro aminopeptidase
MIPLYLPKIRYAKRRQQILQKLEAQIDLVVYFNTPEKLRNYDNSYPYRADSSFLYLTGFSEPNSAFLLWNDASAKKTTRSKMSVFCMPRDPAQEQWNGFRYGPERAAELVGADAGFEINKLEEQILLWLNSRPKGVAPRIWTNASDSPTTKLALERILEKFRPRLRLGFLPIASVTDLNPRVGEQRLVKDADELAILREASKINVEGHKRVMRLLKPGLFEYQVQAEIEYEWTRRGARSPAYGSIVASGANATILHYHDNDRKMKDGDLLLLDAGCEFKFYASDITRTFPVNGTFSPEQRQIMDIVAEAHAEVIRIARPGLLYNKLHETADEVLLQGLISLKLLKGGVKALRETKAVKRYYPHSSGHWLGLDTHDQAPYVDERGNWLKLREGMVLTVEPGLYFMKNDTSVPAEYRGIGVRIEDDIAVKKGAAEILTDGLPRYAAEIEREMKRYSKASAL